MKKKLLLTTLFYLLSFTTNYTFAQLTSGYFSIIGFNGNSSTVNMGIVALKVIPTGTELKISSTSW